MFWELLAGDEGTATGDARGKVSGPGELDGDLVSADVVFEPFTRA
jgi:hypothetical protein